VPFARNHGDAASAPAPLNHTALFWNWNAGYNLGSTGRRNTWFLDVS
jgi:hypothetical protein